MIRRLTIKAYLTNLNGTYLLIPVLWIGTLIALAAAGGDMLYRIGLVHAAAFGLLTGTTLTEIKVKPLSFCMPGQERSMGPAIVVLAAIIGALYSALLLLKPMVYVNVPPIQQFSTLFLWSVGLHVAVVAAALLMRDSLINSIALVIMFFLLIGGLGHEGIAAGWSATVTFLAGSPILAAGFAAVPVIATLRMLASREQSRRLCGSPFLPLKAFDNPLRMEEYKAGMRRTSFRPSSLTNSGGIIHGRLLLKLSERLAGTSWDYMLQESRLSGNVVELAVKVLTTVAFCGFIAFMYGRQDYLSSRGAFPLLFVLFSMIMLFNPPSFKARLSPMLPVSRRQHFRSLLVKAGGIYVFAVAFVLAFRLIVSLLVPVWPSLAGTVLSALVGLRPAEILLLALNVPFLCWGFTVCRSTPKYLIFISFYGVVAVVVMSTAGPSLLTLSFVQVLSITAISWMPFVFIAWKRARRDDLLLS